MNCNCKKKFEWYDFLDMYEENACRIYPVENKTGYGEMRCFCVFPGVVIGYSNLKMGSCYQDMDSIEGILQINHCRSGCFEFELDNDSLYFMREGDLIVNDPSQTKIRSSHLPLGEYEGITIFIELNPAIKWIKEHATWADIDLQDIKEKMQKREDILLMRASAEIEHIFDELYNVDKRVRGKYSILKILELLLFLNLTINETPKRPLRFSPSVVSRTKEVYAFLTNNPLCKLTISELASKFHIAETGLKCCFKHIYGQTPYCFLRNERIRIGAQLLKNYPETNISEIACLVGYENPSKFAKAFKSVIGESPMQYRNQIGHIKAISECKKADLELKQVVLE